MIYSEALKTVIKNYPHPITFNPLKADGSPTKDLTDHMVVRLARLERETKEKDRLISLYRLRERKKNKELEKRHKVTSNPL